MKPVFVAGVGMTRFGQHLDQSYKDLARQALEMALADAGSSRPQLEQAYFSSCVIGQLHGQHMIPGQVALREAGIEGIPVFNVESACASASMAFYLAVQAVQAGACDVALAIGVEKMVMTDKARMFSAFDSAWNVETPDANRARLVAMGAGVEPPPGSQSPKPYSLFMDVYAGFCRQHMKTFGTTQRQIAAVAAKNHQHSVHNPLAQYQKPFTIEEVLAAAPITYPLTLPMCSPISDGAAAAVVCSAAGLERLKGAKGRAIRVLASVVRSGSNRADGDYANHLTAIAARQLYEKAGIGPDAVDVAEVHDATAMGEIIQVENLQLAPYGEGGPRAERGEFTIGGRIPVNPSGGLESKGHPIGATGLGQIHELVTQLRGEAGLRQVKDARIALQENGGGIIGCEEAAAVLNLFGR